MLADVQAIKQDGRLVEVGPGLYAIKNSVEYHGKGSWEILEYIDFFLVLC